MLILTAHGSTDDKVDCFSAGADDYVVKPFDARERVARIKALIRRQSGGMSDSLICGDLQYLSDTREFLHNNTPLVLRRREHAILETLILRQGRTVSKATLTESMFDLNDQPGADAIDIYIHRLRKRLCMSSAQIMTLRGPGYILRSKDDFWQECAQRRTSVIALSCTSDTATVHGGLRRLGLHSSADRDRRLDILTAVTASNKNENSNVVI
ncbi:Response regulator receiver domain-containing protein [Burkholderia sp. OK233]|nr:Response regulator receiver domain-containing protein [Burkholderia sp. OK233]